MKLSKTKIRNNMADCHAQGAGVSGTRYSIPAVFAILPTLALLCLLTAAGSHVYAQDPETTETENQGPTLRPTTASVARIIGVASNPASATAPHFSPDARLRSVKRLSSRLGAEDQQALLAFAAGSRPQDLTWPVWRTMVNDVFDILLSQRSIPSGLDRELLRLAREAEDVVLRDYSIQKLDHLVEVSRAETVRDEVRKLLGEAAALTGTNLQGTALITWKRLRAIEGEPDPMLVDAVKSCLAAGAAKPSSLAAALQVAVELRLPEVAPAARRFLGSVESSVVLKLSSLAALGRCGSPDDVVLLERFIGDPTCQGAALAALAALDNSGRNH